MRLSFGASAIALLAAVGTSVVNAQQCPDGYTRSPSRGGSNNNSTSSCIVWEDCPTDDEEYLQCAILKVPLDWANPNNGQTLDLALVRVPAENATESTKSIIYNPGGPGGSGIQYFAGGGGTRLQNAYAKKFHWISFDPRGVGLTFGYTCPKVTPLDGYYSPWDTDKGVQAQYQTGLNQGKSCAADATYKAAGELVGTAYVARDIKAVFEALCEDGLIRYYGMSYGTLLGATLAGMFPDKIDRAVFDGNVNPASYYNGLRDERGTDTDKALLNFFNNCAEAGPEYCALAEDGETGVDLQNTFYDFVYSLKNGSIVGKNSKGGAVTYRGVKWALFDALYGPRSWNNTAHNIASWYHYSVKSNATTSQRRALAARQFDPWQEIETPLAMVAIRCGDWWGVGLPNAGPALFKDWLKIYNARSKFAGDILIENPTACATWQTNVKEKFSGAWSGIKTKNPVLLINSPYDPVTPMDSARNLSSAFVDKALIVHNGAGHCSTANPSAEAGRRIEAYFNTGLLPKETTQTEPNQENPFVPEADQNAALAELETDETSDECEDNGDDEDCDVDPETGVWKRTLRHHSRREAMSQLADMLTKKDELAKIPYPKALLAAKRDVYEILKSRQVTIPDGCVPINSTSGSKTGTNQGTAYTTVYTTAFVNVCPTGLISVPATVTAVCNGKCTAIPTGVPRGYTTTQVYCSACATPTTVVVTTKITTRVVTPTVVVVQTTSVAQQTPATSVKTVSSSVTGSRNNSSSTTTSKSSSTPTSSVVTAGAAAQSPMFSGATAMITLLLGICGVLFL